MKVIILILSALLAQIHSQCTQTTKSKLIPVYSWLKRSKCPLNPDYITYLPLDYNEKTCYCWSTGLNTYSSADKFNFDIAIKSINYNEHPGSATCTDAPGVNPIKKSIIGQCKIDNENNDISYKIADMTCIIAPTNPKCLKGGSLYGYPYVDANPTFPVYKEDVIDGYSYYDHNQISKCRNTKYKTADDCWKTKFSSDAVGKCCEGLIVMFGTSTYSCLTKLADQRPYTGLAEVTYGCQKSGFLSVKIVLALLAILFMIFN